MYWYLAIIIFEKKMINTLLVTYIMLPKTSAYVKSCDGQSKWMYFLIEDDELIEKYSAIQYKSSGNSKKEFDSRPVHNK